MAGRFAGEPASSFRIEPFDLSSLQPWHVAFHPVPDFLLHVGQ